MRARTAITNHAVSDNLQGHRHTGAYVAIVLDGAYEELSADGAWHVASGNLVVHPQFHFHANTFSGSTRVLNWRIPAAMSAHEVFQTYRVMQPGCIDELLKSNGDLIALTESLFKAKSLTDKEPGDWVDLMGKDIASDPRVPIQDHARRFSISPEHAARRLRNRFLMTPARFRSEQRFQNVLKLLQRSCHSLGEIAQMTGYADQSHFTRHCQKVTGLSPGRLRRSLALH